VAIANGDIAQGRQILNGAVELMRRHACLAGEVMLNSERIAHMILCGENSPAEALLQESLQLLREDGDRHRMQHARLLVMQGKLQLQRGELAACERTLGLAWEMTQEQVGPGFMHTLLGLSEVAAQRGDFQLAFRHLQDAERRMQRLNVNEYGYRGILQLHSLAILIHQGNWEQALPLARQLEEYLLGPTARLAALQSPSFLPRSQLLLAQAELGTGQLQAACNRLQTLHRECRRLGFQGLQGKIERVLRQATERNQENPAERSVQAHKPQSFNLLLGTPGARPSAHGVAQRQSAKELTLREISVLELLAEGLSNQEIGERLYISTNTVKTHTKHINYKLGVTRRTQAILRARTIGVLA
jgi:ATP/maltotriose-dependent transcriptional regulator MalT